MAENRLNNEDNKEIKILLVEDQTWNVKIIEKMLFGRAEYTFSVQVANCLAEAVELLQGNDFDVILLDLGLPDGQELNAISKIYNESIGTPIVAVTALDDKLLRNKFLEQGLQDYLVKGTFDSQQLIETILKAIESKSKEKTGAVAAETRVRIAQLEESEKRHRIIFENSAVAITVVDAEERIVSWNRSTEELFDMGIENLYLKPLNTLYPQKEWERIRSLDIRGAGIPQHIETIMIKSDGSLIDVTLSIAVLKDAAGNVTSSVGVIRDISDRKRAERILRDKAGKSEIVMKLLRALTPEVSVDDMLDLILNAAKSLARADTSSIVLIEEKEHNPKIVALRSSGLGLDGTLPQPSLDASRSITGWVLKNKEPLLLSGNIQDDERFKGIPREENIKCSINVPISFKDSVKGTLNVNITTSDHKFSEDDLETTVALANQVATALEHSGLYKDMKDMYIEELKGSHEVLKKINNELEEARDKLVQSEKMSAVGQLASGVAHEINNPLSGVLGNIQIIKMDIKSGVKIEDMEEILTTIEESARRCKSITQNLLDFSRQKEGVFEAFDIHKALDSTVMLVGYSFKNAGIQINKKYKDDLPLAYGNANELQQIFLNMFSNAKWAIEKSEKGDGTITIETREMDDGFVQVDFGDTGIGISKENMRKIFEAFYTTKEVGVGTGLGLSVCYEIMQRNKGALTVESEEGKGTMFHMKIPVART